MKPGDRVYLTRPLPINGTTFTLPAGAAGVVIDHPGAVPGGMVVVEFPGVLGVATGWGVWVDTERLAREA
jgi:hypothetical protein